MHASGDKTCFWCARKPDEFSKWFPMLGMVSLDLALDPCEAKEIVCWAVIGSRLFFGGIYIV
jgi:hypothetical protein